MRRAALVNGTLLALALGTLAAVWLTREATTTSELESRKHKLFASWHEHAITQIRLRRGAQLLELRREGSGEFHIHQPWRERADVATVRALLGSLELASALRPADGVARPLAGLTTPALEITLESDGKAQALRLGGAAPAPPGARYLEVVDFDQASRLYTVSQGLASELDLPWDKFRETRLLQLSRDDIAKIGIVSPSGAAQLTRKSHGFMLVRGDDTELADGEALERLLTALSRIVSEQFVEPDVARGVLGQEALRLTLEPTAKDRKPVSLLVGGSCPGASEQALVLREGDGQSARAGCIPREVSGALHVTPAMLELVRPFSARLDEVELLELRAGEQKLELARKDGGFLLKLPTRSEVPLDAGNQRLSQIVGAKGERMAKPDLSALGLEPAAGSAAIQLTGGGQPGERREVVQLGRPRADGSICLRREADRVVLCLQPDDARAFQPDATLLKSLELWSFAASQLASFSVETPELNERVRRTPDGSYELERPAGLRHDGALVSDTVELLGALRAERWVAARAEPAHGLASPRLRVNIELGGDRPERRELAVGAPSGAGFFASLSPDPGIFLLARSSVQQLEQPRLDRALCPVPRGELQRIELRQGTRELALVSRGETWEASGVSPARASELGEALSSLRADFTVRIGAAQPGEGLGHPRLSVRFVDTRGQARQLRVGARATLQGSAVAYARLDGVDASFALSATTLDALRDF